MKIHFFGTGAGTLPKADRYHLSFAIELENGIYWFDAGENCSHTAYLMGVNLHKIRSIFISHCHMDHIGGLGNLLWNIRKITQEDSRSLPIGKHIDVYVPIIESYDAVMNLLKNTEGNFECNYTHSSHLVKDGLIFSSEFDDIKVTAIHNNHIHHEEGTPWVSYSYLIEAEGKKIVFSGDLRLEDLDNVLPDECDVFMMETGHHNAKEVCEAINNTGKKIKKLFFNHNGSRLLNNLDESLKIANELFDGEIMVCNDATSCTL